jgi:hypothetical protein
MGGSFALLDFASHFVHVRYQMRKDPMREFCASDQCTTIS